MSRSHLLRLVADRGDGRWLLPAAIEGLRENETPTLYFHDVGMDSVGPWLERLNADPVAVTRKIATTSCTVTTWSGSYLGTDVEIRLYRVAR